MYTNNFLSTPLIITSYLHVVTSYLQVIPLDEDGRAVGNHTYVKTGLIGFVNSSGSIFVAGTVGGIIKVAGTYS